MASCPVNSRPLSNVMVCTRSWYGFNKRTISCCTARDCLCGTCPISVNFRLRSTNVTKNPWWCAPLTKSASQSPVRLFSSTSLGRCSISTRLGIFPRQSFPPRCFRLWLLLFWLQAIWTGRNPSRKWNKPQFKKTM